MNYSDQYNSNSPQLKYPLWLNHLNTFSKKLLSFPGFGFFQPFYEKAKAVAEPTINFSIQTRPKRTATLEKGGISVLSANLWHDWPRFRKLEERLEQLARLVEQEKIDVLMLQEVSRTPALHVDEWLSERLGMNAIYTRANGKSTSIGFEEGLAIMSHLPLTEPRLRPLGNNQNPFVRRLALSADVMTESGRLALFSVHLGLMPHQNNRQMANLLHWVKTLAHNRPALIGGDFNAHETSTHIQNARKSWLDTFRHLNPEANGITHELFAWGRIPLSRRRLDYIFFQEHQASWQIKEARHLKTPEYPHSDHKAVLLRLIPGKNKRTAGTGYH